MKPVSAKWSELFWYQKAGVVLALVFGVLLAIDLPLLVLSSVALLNRFLVWLG